MSQYKRHFPEAKFNPFFSFSYNFAHSLKKPPKTDPGHIYWAEVWPPELIFSFNDFIFIHFPQLSQKLCMRMNNACIGPNTNYFESTAPPKIFSLKYMLWYMYLMAYALNVLLELIRRHIFCFSLLNKRYWEANYFFFFFSHPIRNVNSERQFSAKGKSIFRKFLQKLIVLPISTPNCSGTQTVDLTMQFLFNVRTHLQSEASFLWTHILNRS